MARRLALCGAVLLVLAPVELVFFYVRAYGVQSLHTDEWLHVPTVLAMFEGRLTLADLTAQFNEHRILLPRLLMLGLDRLSRFDNKLWMYASWACACATALFLGLAFRRRAGLGGVKAIVAYVPVIWLVFSLRQFEAFLWGWELQIFVCEAFCALSLWQLSERRLGTAALAALAATFSWVPGLLLWPVGAVQLAHDRAGWRRGAAWCAAGVVSVGWFFLGYHFFPTHGDTAGWFSRPTERFSLLLVGLGTPVALSVPSARLLGGAAMGVAGLLAALAVRGRIRAGPGPSLALLALLCCVLVAGGRVSYGAAGVFNSRYAVFAGLFFIGAWMAAVEARLPALAAAILGMVLWGQIGAVRESFALGEARRVERLELAYIERTFAFQTDADLKQLFFEPAHVRAVAPELERLRLNVFSRPIPGPSGAAEAGERVGTLERVLPAIAAGQVPVDLEGWAADPRTAGPLAGLVLEIDGRHVFPVLGGYPRPDVAARLGARDDALGFRAHLWLGPLGPGRHELRVRALSEGKIYQVPPVRSVEVK